MGKLDELTADSPPKLVAKVVSQALGLRKELGPEPLPKDVLAAARKAMPRVRLPKDALPKEALLIIAKANLAERKAKEAAQAKAKRAAKRSKARQGAMGEMPPSESSEEEYDDEESAGGAEISQEAPATPRFVQDKFGNTITIEEAARQKAEQEEREAAARRRAAKAAAAAAASEDTQSTRNDDSSLQEQLATARAKLAANEKLSMREKRLVKKYGKEPSAVAPEPEHQESDELESFSFTLGAGGSRCVDQADDMEYDGKGTRDVVVADFSIAAPSMPLFVGANLHLVAGKKYGLLGPNGRGKTTLLRFLAARRLPLPPNIKVLLVQQEVEASSDSVVAQVCAADVEGVKLLAEEQRLLNTLEAMESDEGVSVVEWEAKVNHLSSVSSELESKADLEPRARKILAGLGFSNNMVEAGTESLSGGWRMRVSLARALLMTPELLLLDEPTNHLDLDAKLWLEEHLQKEWKGTVLAVSHDAGFLDGVTSALLHLQGGQLERYEGDVDAFCRSRSSRLDKRKRDYEKQQKLLAQYKGGSKKMSERKAEKEVLAQLKLPMLVERPREYSVRFEFLDRDDGFAAIGAHDVGFGYGNEGLQPHHEDEGQLFDGLNFGIHGDSRIAVVGKNGGGKSTLLRLLSGQLLPTKGEISIERRCVVGSYDQHFEVLHEVDARRTSALKFLQQKFPDVKEQEARASLGMFGLSGPQHLVPMEALSGGQKARVVFAFLRLLRPHILLLDEPTNHLDLESVDALIAGLAVWRGGVVLVSHDERLVATANELWVCDGRKADGGLRLEKGGFDAYRQQRIAMIEAKAAQAARNAAIRAQQQYNARRERVAKLAAAKRGK